MQTTENPKTYRDVPVDAFKYSVLAFEVVIFLISHASLGLCHCLFFFEQLVTVKYLWKQEADLMPLALCLWDLCCFHMIIHDTLSLCIVSDLNAEVNSRLVVPLSALVALVE